MVGAGELIAMDRAEVSEKKIFGKYCARCPEHKDKVMAINSVPFRQFDVAGDRRVVRRGFNPHDS